MGRWARGLRGGVGPPCGREMAARGGEGGLRAAPPAGLRPAGLPDRWHEQREDGLPSLPEQWGA